MANHSETQNPLLSTDDEKTNPGLTPTHVEKEEPTLNNIPIPPHSQAPQSTPSIHLTNQKHSSDLRSHSQTPPLSRKIKMPEMDILDSFMGDPSVTEIMVNELKNIVVEKDGKLQLTPFRFEDIEDLNRITRNISDFSGKILTPDQPYLDLMLPDGSRVNVIAPPLTLNGPYITIRKFPLMQLSIHDLIKNEALDQRMAYFLNACVLSRLNIIVCGGTGSGKTTLLNCLVSLIPKSERIIVIEDTAELAIHHVNSVRLQTKPATPTSCAIQARDLVANALRMRPDRIIVGECRKGEAFDMLQTMNTGHAGSMTSLHANSARDALARLESLCMLAGAEIPLTVIRKQITSAVDLVVHIKRYRDGKRRITQIAEVTGMESDTITLQDLFIFEHESPNTDKNKSHRFLGTGFVHTFLDKMKEEGIELPKNYFN